MALPDLLAEFGQSRLVRFGLDLRICDFILAISDLGGAAIAMIDRNHLFDVVQLDRRSRP